MGKYSCARPYHLNRERFILARAENHDRQVRRLGGQEGDLEQARGVGRGQFKQDCVKGLRRQPGHAGVQGRRGCYSDRLSLGAKPVGESPGKLVVAGNQQHFQQFRVHSVNRQAPGAGRFSSTRPPMNIRI